MRVLLTGAGGLLGSSLVHVLGSDDVLSLTRAELDITDAEAVQAAVGAFGPDVVVNAAAIANVDACESDPQRSFAVNAIGPRNLALAASRSGAALCHVSTDYVFGGSQPAGGPQLYREWDPTGPVNVYGRSKLAGENEVRSHCRRHYVVRTSWLFGRGDRGALAKALRLFEADEVVQAVCDQWNVPTPADALAATISALVRTERFGTYHAAGRGKVSRADWCRAVAAAAGLDPGRVQDVSRVDHPFPTFRPADSGMDSFALRASGLADPGDWRPALTAAVA